MASTVSIEAKASMLAKSLELYGDRGSETAERIASLIGEFGAAASKGWVSESDVMLISYGDSIGEEGVAPLVSLRKFLNRFARGTVSAVHLLPFYPYTSDDGFSVVDYDEVDPRLGSWEDIAALAGDYDLMFDGVVNHISKSSRWFQGYLQGDSPYAGYFTEADPSADYSSVTRPRNLPLLTRFETADGEKYVWTTFSDDQIDLNFQNPDVLLEILRILLRYTQYGARFIRLDAIGFSWKKLGTTCMHLPELHTLVKLMREVVDIVAPGTILVTETNVPHLDNIGYFGNGDDEAHMVYQFPLPPLTLFSFHAGNARKLTEWAESLEPTSPDTTFFNFLSSHDGIGMRPVEDRLTANEKQLMIDKALAHGGRVSYKANGDGTTSAYELNVNYLDALSHPAESDDERVSKFLAAHAILLSMAGVPGIYVHSLLGSRNDIAGLERSGINRRINREKLDRRALEEELEDSGSLRHRIFGELSKLIRLRRGLKAFHPRAAQRVLRPDDRIFALLREDKETGERILALANVSGVPVPVGIGGSGIDLVSGQAADGVLELRPYQFCWIQL